MKIILNNQHEEIVEEQISLAELIRLKNFTFKMLVTKINGEVVKTDDREITMVKEGDDVLVLHLISGG